MPDDWLQQARGAIPRGCTISQAHGTSLIHDPAGWLVGAMLGDDGKAQHRACLVVCLPSLLDAVEQAIAERRTDAMVEAMEEVRALVSACRTQ
jgi:hypothetical protein